jgi:hypothetical protein
MDTCAPIILDNLKIEWDGNLIDMCIDKVFLRCDDGNFECIDGLQVLMDSDQYTEFSVDALRELLQYDVNTIVKNMVSSGKITGYHWSWDIVPNPYGDGKIEVIAFTPCMRTARSDKADRQYQLWSRDAAAAAAA